MPVSRRNASSAFQPGASPVRVVSNPAPNIANTISGRRPSLSESMPATTIATASGPVASETARLAASALRRNSSANSGSSGWAE